MRGHPKEIGHSRNTVEGDWAHSPHTSLSQNSGIDAVDGEGGSKEGTVFAITKPLAIGNQSIVHGIGKLSPNQNADPPVCPISVG